MPSLSILILSINSRADLLARLLETITPQLTPEVELLTLIDNGEKSIGAKRNELLDKSTGRYVCFVDDDDLVADDFVASITNAIKLDPDAVGFRLAYSVDGRYQADAIHSIRNRKWETVIRDGKRVYLRTPNHLNPVRREIALRHRFPELNHGEDREFSQRIMPDISTEVFIDCVMYQYLYRSKKVPA